MKLQLGDLFSDGRDNFCMINLLCYITDCSLTLLGVTVRVWYCYASDENRLCITWDVHFAGLVRLAAQV